MVESHRRRLANVKTLLSELRVDGLLVNHPVNIRYLTGFSGSSGLLLLTPQDTTIITDFRYQAQVEEEAGAVASIVIEPENLWNALWKHLGRSAGVRILGFESAHTTHREFERLVEAGARWQWRPTEDLVESLRQRKDRRELELITEAARVATRALDAVLQNIRPGMTENQIAGLLEKELREAGSEGSPFPVIVASGPRSAMPHARTSKRAVSAGELVLLDFGANVGGYCSDITRTVVLGRAGSRERDVYSIVRAANRTAREEIRAGMKGKDADALARTQIERAGFGSNFGHGLGHGIGLEVHEAPRLSRTAESTLPPSSVVTIEPGVYIPGWGGVRIEDDVYLSTDGPRLLTEFTRELVEIR